MAKDFYPDEDPGYAEALDVLPAYDGKDDEAGWPLDMVPSDLVEDEDARYERVSNYERVAEQNRAAAKAAVLRAVAAKTTTRTGQALRAGRVDGGSRR